MSSIQKPVVYGLSAIVILGTAYSVLCETYLDTSNPLLTHLPHPLSHTHYFASKKNFLNVYFIKKAWGWTSAIFLFSWLTSPQQRQQQSQNHATTRLQRFATWLLLTGVWITFTSWFFGPAILERVVAASGGECILPGPDNMQLVVPNEYCYTRSTISAASHPHLFQEYLTVNGGNFAVDVALKGVPRLRRGHDVSGHLFLLTMSILLLTNQLQASFKAGQRYWSQLHQVSVLANALLIAIWLFASATTSVYFHSPFEKFTGFALGLAAYGLIQIPVALLLPAQPVDLGKGKAQ
ncbi:hypothetical protein EST38_g13716 [Candolleomyces aberdarensis]|uniref:Inositol phospholipid synthesis and fat-storage-inducing TM-domain-containing protein n=1 Tax=Candolleomyces aberdarensis TaxID=2316362 RepID=A0A4Q2D1X0_9AGAR|nr:hypothetical protein EST38_g13716 [Candolleomyces aberdarensis]